MNETTFTGPVITTNETLFCVPVINESSDIGHEHVVVEDGPESFTRLAWEATVRTRLELLSFCEQETRLIQIHGNSKLVPIVAKILYQMTGCPIIRAVDEENERRGGFMLLQGDLGGDILFANINSALWAFRDLKDTKEEWNAEERD